MKKLIVIFFLLSIIFAEWQQREGFTLPKGIQVNDIKIGTDSKVWILTRSALSQVDFVKKSLILFSEVKDGKLFAIGGNDFFIIDNNNKLWVLSADGEIRIIPIVLINPTQIEVVKVGKKNILFITEPSRINFTEGGEISTLLNADVEKFSILTPIDTKEEITIYTMTNNQIYMWAGGSLSNPAGYKCRLLYSASENIIDFTTGADGKNYILFKDSIVVLKPDGTSDEKFIVENIPLDSKIFIIPGDNNLLLFDRNEKLLRVLSRVRQVKNEIITLNKNRPNPVDNYTEIEFSINEPMYLTLTIYNLIGKPVKVIASGYYNPGTHIIPWHADDEKGILVPNGVYFYRLETKKGVLIKQLIVLR